MTSGPTSPTGSPSATRGAAVHDAPAGAASPPGPSTPMSSLLAQNWWALALRGVFAILFGLIALFNPGATLLTLVLFFSAYMLVDGVFGIVAGVRAASRHERWGLLVAEGVLDILVGVIAFAWPGLTLVTFVYLLAIWSVVTGGLVLAAAFKLHAEHGRVWMILSGIISILFGIALFIGPLAGAVVLAWWIGVYAVAFGITMLVLAFRLKGRNDRGTGALAGT